MYRSLVLLIHSIIVNTGNEKKMKNNLGIIHRNNFFYVRIEHRAYLFITLQDHYYINDHVIYERKIIKAKKKNNKQLRNGATANQCVLKPLGIVIYT